MSTEFVQPDLLPALPEMVMLAMTCLVLVVDLFLPQEKRGFTLLLSVLTLILAIAAVVMVAPTGTISSFGGSFVLDQLAVVLKIATCVVTALVFVYSRDYLLDHDMYKGEYYVLGLFATLAHHSDCLCGSLLQFFDHGLDFAGGVLCASSQGSDFIGNNGETPSLLTGAGRFNCSVQRQQIGLFRNPSDDIQHSTDIGHIVLQLLDYIGGTLHILGQSDGAFG